MPTYVLYGVKTKNIEEARGWLECLTKLPADGRHSEYYGNYYLFHQSAQERLRLVSGVITDQEDVYPTESSFPHWPLLIYLNAQSERSVTKELLSSSPGKFTQLSSETIP